MVILYLLVIFYLAFSFIKGIINIDIKKLTNSWRLINIIFQIIKLCAIIGLLIIIINC